MLALLAAAAMAGDLDLEALNELDDDVPTVPVADRSVLSSRERLVSPEYQRGWRKRYEHHQRAANQVLWLIPVGVGMAAAGGGAFYAEGLYRNCVGPDACDTPGLLGMGGAMLVLGGLGLVAVTPMAVGMEAGNAQRELVLGGANLRRTAGDAAIGLTVTEVVFPPAWIPALAFGLGQLAANRAAFERMELAAAYE